MDAALRRATSPSSSHGHKWITCRPEEKLAINSTSSWPCWRITSTGKCRCTVMPRKETPPKSAHPVAIRATWHLAAQTHPARRMFDQTAGQTHSDYECKPHSETGVVALLGGLEASCLSVFWSNLCNDWINSTTVHESHWAFAHPMRYSLEPGFRKP
jgi:hypothetical protein